MAVSIDDEGRKVEEKTEVLVQDLHMKDAPDMLPDEVFPISMQVVTDRKTREDSKHPEIREPDYPITAWRADPMPYIPSKKVYFFNPVELSNQPGESGRFKTWEYPEFVRKIDEAREMLALEDPSIKERMYLSGVDLVEVPSEYVMYEDKQGNEVDVGEVEEYRDDLGHTPSHIRTRVRHTLYEDREEMVIARFGKRQSIQSKEGLEKIKETVPGNVIKPLKLTELITVHAKEYRGTNETVGAATKKMYFSTAQAMQYNDPDLRPIFFKARDDWNDENDDAERPIEMAINGFDQRMPYLGGSEFIVRPTFIGYWDTQERFVYGSIKDIN